VSVRQLLHAIDRATTARELKLRVMDGVTAAFGTGATGLYLFGPTGDVDEMHVSGVRDGFVLVYEQLGRDQDPILSRALDTGVTTHDQDVFEADGWPRSRLYRECGAPWQIKHYLCAPIAAGGRVIGTVNLGRRSEQHPFADRDVAGITAVCTRLGQRLDTLARSTAGDDDDFGKLRAQRTRIRMQVDDLERDAIPLDDVRTGEVWESFATGGVVALDTFDRDDRTYVLLPARARRPAPHQPLTRRESDVAVRAAAGMANKAIAFELGISPNTVGTTLASARAKLRVTSRVKLVEAVRRLGLG